MLKNCCAVGCYNTYKKGSGIQFYRFPTDPERRAQWIAAVNRKDWAPTEYTWICSAHFVSRSKSNNPLSPNYVPTIFSHTESPVKRKMEAQVESFERRQTMKRKRIDNTPLPSNEEYNAEDCDEACGSSSAALSEEFMVERAIKDQEKRHLQVYCLEVEAS